MKRTIAVLALLTALALPAGCALGPKAESSDASVSAAESAPVSAEVSDTLDAVQGHWVDVNGDHTLDIDGKKLTLSYGQWSDTYRFKVERRGSFEYLVGRDPEGFGTMSELEVCADNERGIRLYKKFDFVEYGRIPQAMRRSHGEYMDEILMVRRL